MNREKAYKVVTKTGNELISFSAYGKATLEYKPGEVTKAHGWTLREGFGIFCFRDFSTARKWVAPCVGSIEIWQVEGVGKMEVPIYMADQDALGKGNICLLPGEFPPVGTSMYRAVRLVKRIWRF